MWLYVLLEYIHSTKLLKSHISKEENMLNEEAIQKVKISSILWKLMFYCFVEFTKFSRLMVCIYCVFWGFSIIFQNIES